MAGIFGVAAKENCIETAYKGAFYLQHRAQDYCGRAYFKGVHLQDFTNGGLIKQQFSPERKETFKGNLTIGLVSVTREPVSESSLSGEGIVTFDGNIRNNQQVNETFLRQNESFSGYHDPKEVPGSVLISKIIARESKFERGIEEPANITEGDFSVICLKKEGIENQGNNCA